MTTNPESHQGLSSKVSSAEFPPAPEEIMHAPDFDVRFLRILQNILFWSIGAELPQHIAMKAYDAQGVQDNADDIFEPLTLGQFKLYRLKKTASSSGESWPIAMSHFKTISPKAGGDPNVAAVHPCNKLDFEGFRS